METKNIKGVRLGAVGLALALALGGVVSVGTGPAQAVGDESGKNCGAPAGQPGTLTNDGRTWTATCADGATVTIPMKVKAGQKLHITGKGFKTKDGKPSFIAQKYDNGGGYRPVTKPKDPDGLEVLPTDTMDAFTVGKDGSWTHDFALLTKSNNKGKVEWKAGEKHTIHLLTGSIVPNDNVRGVRVEFTITDAQGNVPSQPAPTTSAPPKLVKAGAVSVSGTAKVGKKVSVKKASWKNATAYKYQWLRSGKKIAKATKSTYTAVAADKGKKLSVTVTGTKKGYKQAAKTSKATAAVKAGTITKGSVKISGKAKAKKKLKAKVSKFKPGGLKYSYQWLANGKKIKKATKSSYKIAKKYKGKKISVKVTAKKSGYTTVTKTSAKTKKVKK